MNIAGALKVGITAVIATKLAIGSYKMCKSWHKAATKHDYLVSKGVPLEQLIFATEEQINALMEQYA